jgi:hypothetical protein
MAIHHLLGLARIGGLRERVAFDLNNACGADRWVVFRTALWLGSDGGGLRRTGGGARPGALL